MDLKPRNDSKKGGIAPSIPNKSGNFSAADQGVIDQIQSNQRQSQSWQQSELN
jgi:hypothetical protein